MQAIRAFLHSQILYTRPPGKYKRIDMLVVHKVVDLNKNAGAWKIMM